MSTVVMVILLALLGMVFLFGTVVNSLVFLVFYRRPSLRSLSNRFVLSLTSANLVSTMVVVPVQALRLAGLTHLMSSASAGGAEGQDVSRGAEQFWWCQASKALMALAVEAAIFSVLLIAVDRYCAVTSPLHYSMTITRGRSVRLIVGVWTLALFYALPQLLAHAHPQNRPASQLSACPSGRDIVTSVPVKFGIYYAVLLALCGFLVPLFVLIWIYVRMYRAAQRNSARTRRHSLGHNPNEIIMPECPSTPDSGNQNSVRCKTRLHRRRSSNTSISSLFFREEGRAVKTAVIVISSFVASWFPYYLYRICEASGWIKDIPFVDEIINYLALSSSCTMPFIYVYRNETASKEALKIVCWWRPPSPATPAFSRSSLHPKLGNGHPPTPVRIIEPDTASLYSYATECGACGHNQLVCSLRKGRPVTSPLPPETRRTSPRRESTVSFKLTPMDRPSSRCRQCLRQDSASSASSDDPLLNDCFRHHRTSNPSVRWTRPRMSNGSVATRSDSLASTNSSVISAGIQRWPMRRYSTVSTDSGGTITTRRSAIEDLEEESSQGRLSSGGQRSLFLESEEDTYEASSNQPEMHGYSNPFRHPRLSHRQESIGGSSVRFIWEIEEGLDDDSTETEGHDAPTR